MAKTIEQRADEFAEREYINDQYDIGYYHGATEQRKIDIEKACKWLLANRQNYDYINADGDVYDISLINDFKQAMEED